jgi:hypothetical protein
MKLVTIQEHDTFYHVWGLFQKVIHSSKIKNIMYFKFPSADGHKIIGVDGYWEKHVALESLAPYSDGINFSVVYWLTVWKMVFQEGNIYRKSIKDVNSLD